MEMNHIRQLPPEVIGQIAAGEVVERPAAAIKELVENSMDAGATAITVDIKEGGLTSFRVADNGSGIQPEDIRLAFARHATSKIRKVEDLYGVRSLGFRGEALASIAAVAIVTCQTRARGADTGVYVRNEGGEIVEIKDAACPEGTTFTVKDLFYNAPVRRKFLKKPSTETAAVSELMARLILSHPAVSFRFMADGKLVYFSAGDGKLDSAVMSVYGMDTLKMMTKIDGSMNGVLLHGFVGVGDVSRGNRSHEHFFLNGRAMKSPLLSAAVEAGCRQRVMIGKFPMCVLHLDMPFESADVNVHPNKWEVRFQDEKGVRQAVETIIFETLEKTNEAPPIPPMFLPAQDAAPRPAPARIEVTESLPQPATDASTSAAAHMPVPMAQPAPTQPAAPQQSSKWAAFSEDGMTLPTFAPAVPRETRPVLIPKEEKRPAAFHDSSASILPARANPQPVIPPDMAARFRQKQAEQMPISVPAESAQADQLQSPVVAARFSQTPLKLIGVAFNTYILLEYGDLLIMADQHAVHERLLYERFMRETASAPASQSMMVPLIVKLSKAEYAAYEENTEALKKAGFDLSPFGEDTVQLRGVPIILGQPQAEKCLMEALDGLMADASSPIADRTSRVIQMACKHAVKGGERLSDESVMALIRDVIEQKVTPTCPHGRPLMVQMTHTELDKRFRRIQN
ncbi:MAG: DNA mismatch repair endonuclease MutL [Clostridia bacterium]|nr:DNA mismatch repair endonuclease MutL [Clostridia bacterium]